MQDRDWTGTAAAVTALALTAGVWLWPEQAPRPSAPSAGPHTIADNRADDDMADLARWRAEARRWDGTADAVQLSAAAGDSSHAVVR